MCFPALSSWDIKANYKDMMSSFIRMETAPLSQRATPGLLGQQGINLSQAKQISRELKTNLKMAGIKENDVLIATELKIFLIETGIKIYPYHAVKCYLDTRTYDISSCSHDWKCPHLSHEWRWVWAPLRSQDNIKTQGGVSLPHLCTAHFVTGSVSRVWERNGDIKRTWWESENIYKKAIPVQTLKRISNISRKFPHAHFYVSEFSNAANPQPKDTFLALTSRGSRLYVIDYWN